jgi:hypothetical protein
LNLAGDVGWGALAVGLVLLLAGWVLRQWPSPLLACFEAVPTAEGDLEYGRVSFWCRRSSMVQGDEAIESFLQRVETGGR